LVVSRILLGLRLPQLGKKNREIDGLAAAATRQKSGKLDQKIRVVATATRKKKLIKEKELNKQ